MAAILIYSVAFLIILLILRVFTDILIVINNLVLIWLAFTLSQGQSMQYVIGISALFALSGALLTFLLLPYSSFGKRFMVKTIEEEKPKEKSVEGEFEEFKALKKRTSLDQKEKARLFDLNEKFDS